LLCAKKTKKNNQQKERMCGILLTWWIGRKNNGAIIQNDVRGSAINTRVVKLAPVERKETKISESVKDEGRQEGLKVPEGNS
jgi:hypothetical protein